MPLDLQSVGTPSDSVRDVGTADGAVLLDMRQGLCVSLTPVGAKIWQRLKSGGSVDEIVGCLSLEFQEVSPTQIHDDALEFIDDLRAKGLILCDTTPSPVQPLPKLLVAVQKLHNRSVNKPAVSSRLMFWKALCWLIAFDLFHFGEDFPRIHAFVKSWTVSSGRAPASPGIVEKVCQAINRACIVYPNRVLCLQRSVATTCLLRTCGIDARMAIGAQKVPFKAHAWTEVEDKAVNERRNVQSIYLVWERC
jgi:hypothetical protein